MTLVEVKAYLANLTGHVTFNYNGYYCGIDPLAQNKFDLWCGSDETTVNSIDEVVTAKFFDGKSLEDIWNDVENLDF